MSTFHRFCRAPVTRKSKFLETPYFKLSSNGTTHALHTLRSTMAVPSKRILLVEENGECRHLLAELLSCLGYAITEATTGLDGIYKAANEIPDLIMMGAELPQLTGIEVTTWLKKHPYTKDIPVLIYAPSPSPGGEDDAWRAGASAIINDPITVDALRHAFQLCFPRRKETLRDAGYDSQTFQYPIVR